MRCARFLPSPGPQKSPPPPLSPKPPADAVAEAALDPAEKRLAGALMRVNHVGEVCAQALYTAQAALTRDARLPARLQQAAREEIDHLAWTRQRLDALGARTSLLDPLWFAGAFALGPGAAQGGGRGRPGGGGGGGGGEGGRSGQRGVRGGDGKPGGRPSAKPFAAAPAAGLGVAGRGGAHERR